MILLPVVKTGVTIVSGIGGIIIYKMKNEKMTDFFKGLQNFEGYVEKIEETRKKIISCVVGNLDFGDKEKQPQDTEDKNFSLLLITTAEKIRGNIDVSAGLNGECDQIISLETVKKLINTSRYFLIEDEEDNILNTAKTSDNLPDLEKNNLFILKITGQGKHNIATHKTKLGLRSSITSETCKIEKILHYLDARIDEKFITTT